MPPTKQPRRPDADARLQALVASRLKAPFAWGTQDCALFAADCAQVCTGVDHAADLRGRYRTQRGALRALRRAVGPLPAAALLPALLTARLGEPIAGACARAGDVGLLRQVDGRDLVAVCTGTQWLAPAAHGLEPVPAPDRCWSIS